VTGEKPEQGCVFCNAQAAAGAESLIVYEGRQAFVILNLYPYNNGHVMVVPRRHVSTLASLAPDELQEMARLTQLTEVALTQAYQPQGINVGINLGKPAGAGILDHLHIHAVPRWNGDTNWGPLGAPNPPTPARRASGGLGGGGVCGGSGGGGRVGRAR
jgi:ATP adenylyltransferase